MLSWVLNGLFAAGAVCSVLYMQDREWRPAWLAVFVIIAAAIQYFLLDRKRGSRLYDGTSDVIYHIHSPSKRETSSARWLWHGILSWFLSWVQGSVGPEAVAAELSYSAILNIRSDSERWFEQRRRTDAACVVSSAVAAAFGAPFAAVLVPVELGMGGRLLSTVICALSATIGVKTAKHYFGLRSFDLWGILEGTDYASPRTWISLLALAVVAGLLAVAWIRFTTVSRKLMGRMTTRHGVSARMLVTGLFLLILSAILPWKHLLPVSALHDLLLGNIMMENAPLIAFASAIALTLALVGYGTMGVFTPVFALGGFVGYAFFGLGLNYGLAGLAPLLALAGACAFWGAVLDLPIASGILIFELTGEIQAALLCLVVAVIAQKIARRLTGSLINENLAAKGLRIVEGRSLAILQELKVRDAMVMDFETIHEQEPVSELPNRLLASRYPFLPVVRADETYTGLVTVDMVQDRLQETHATLQVSKLFEVKDLLYSSGFKTKTLHADDPLSQTKGMFQDVPCVPVVDGEGRVVGLLFVHHVRMAYEREVARRSLKASESARQPLLV